MDRLNRVMYLVSACLSGEKCRYDGNSNSFEPIKMLVEKGSALPVCPELLGGLSIPRARCEIMINENGIISVTGEDGNDYSKNFILGAVKSLKIAEKNGIKIAILKSKSPSCGRGLIYDGSFKKKLIEGNGVTTELFIKSGIKVFTEEDFLNQILE